jgi:aspartyl/asparaginyl beta-hydroxylase (cupin superfamily)
MADAVHGHERPMTTDERLELARSLEARQEPGDALLAYYRAIIESQRRGLWLGRDTTPPALVERVNHAMRYVKAGRRRVFEAALAPVRARQGDGALARFDACLANLTGEKPAARADARQRPSILYFPGIPASPWVGRADLPWFEALERATDEVREELAAVMPRTTQAERVFDSDESERRGLAGAGGAPSWNGFYFFRHGEPREENLALCPRTAALLASLPLCRIREHAPEAMFSVLAPGTHILPHRGVTNTRIVCHLPLIVPEGCALVVGGERHAWREGEAIAFDDTYEHEAWNRGNSTRVVLIIDVWHPGLTAAEREAVAVLVEAMGDFNKAAGL